MNQPNLFLDTGALFCPDRTYRYLLWRVWDTSKPAVNFIGLNPSTADEVKDDNTIRKCIKFSKTWGFGGYYMTNIFAYRATDPKVMKAHPEPVGPENDHWLADTATKAGLVLAAWGTHGAHLNRHDAVLELLPTMYCLTVTKDGFPGHPLYLPDTTMPILYQVKAESRLSG